MSKSARWQILRAIGGLVAIALGASFMGSAGQWWLLAIFAVAFLFSIPFIFWQLKRNWIAALSSSQRRATSPDEFEKLSANELEVVTRQWQDMGFVWRGDYSYYETHSKIGTVFSRLLEHENEGAIVEVLQQFTPAKTFPLRSNLMSFWGQDEREQIIAQSQALQRAAIAASPLASPDVPQPPPEIPEGSDLRLWVSMTHANPPNRLSPLLRHPRVLGARLEMGSSPAQLWQMHQHRSALVQARLGTPPLRGDLVTLVEAYGRVLGVVLARRLRATSVLAFAIYSLSRKPVPAFYDGELAPLDVHPE